MLHVAANLAFFDGTAKALAAYLVLFRLFRSVVRSPGAGGGARMRTNQ
jgi:hypothetical protein